MPSNDTNTAPLAHVGSTEELSEASPERACIELINWLEQDPLENLQAVVWQLRNGKAKTVRESIEYHLRLGL